MKNIKKGICLLLVLWTLLAASAGAETLTGEVIIDGQAFTLNALVRDPSATQTVRHTAKAVQWGMEPKERFDISAVMKNPQDAQNVDCGFDGERMYIVGRTFNRYCDESLRFDLASVEYHTLFGLNIDGMNDFSYVDLTDTVANPDGKQVFEGVYRARNPEAVPDLQGITYAEALAVVEAYKGPFETGVALGEAYYVEAWDAESRLAYARYAAGGETLLQSEVDAVLAEPDYYVIRFRTSLTDQPALAGFSGLTGRRNSAFDGEDIFFDRSDAVAVVSANGLERLQVSPYLEGFEQQGSLSPVLTAHEALEAVRQAQDFFTEYDNDFLPWDATAEYQAEIVEIAPELFVRPNQPYDGTYTVIPVWAFHVRVREACLYPDAASIRWEGGQESLWKTDRYTLFAIDAATGERVL